MLYAVARYHWRGIGCRRARCVRSWIQFDGAINATESVFALEVRAFRSVSFSVPGTQVRADEVSIASWEIASVYLLGCICLEHQHMIIRVS